MLDKSVKRGLSWLNFGWFCHGFLLMVPVIVLIYTQKGITVGDFFLIQAIYRIAGFLFEIPSGYMSDCLSRKKVMISGAIFTLAGYITIVLAYGFWTLVLGEAFLGIADALFSGTLEAYAYDLLKRNQTQKQFLKEFGNIQTWSGIASFIAMIAGGILYGYIGINILWIDAVIATLSIIAFLFLPELSEVKRIVKHKEAIVDAISITTDTLKNPKLRNLILFPSLFAALTTILLWIMQPIMETSNIPVSLFGFYFGINQFFVIIMSKYTYKICEKFGEIQTSLISIGSIIIGIMMGLLAIHIQNMTIVYIACTIMAITPSFKMLNNLQYNTLIHHSIKSSERGTVLSTRTMVTTVIGAIGLIMAKFLIDEYGITTTLVFTFITTSLLIWSLKKAVKYIK